MIFISKRLIAVAIASCLATPSIAQVQCVMPDGNTPSSFLSAGSCGDYLNYIPDVNHLNYYPQIVERITILRDQQ